MAPDTKERTQHIESRVSRIEGEVEQLVNTVSTLARTVVDGNRELNAKLDAISTASHPNFGLMAQWSGVLLSVIALVATPIAFHFHQSLAEVDAKLQKEYSLISESQKASISEMRQNFEDVREKGSPITRERLSKLETRAETLGTLYIESIKADLEELRRRRIDEK